MGTGTVSHVITARFDALDLSGPWEAALDRLDKADAVTRLWDRDHTIVQPDPEECADRFGWLDVIADSTRRWPEWARLADELSDEVDHVLVVGMGGSSLFPEVLAETFDAGDGFPNLSVIDTTDPAAVERIAADHPVGSTAYVVSSKSGSTIETRSHLTYLWDRDPDPSHFVVVTDPGSALEQLARDRGFRHVAHGVPEIGGRYSALSAFGLVPAALMGLDGTDLLDAADEASAVLGPDTPVTEHLGCQLGALMAVAAQQGRDRLTFLIDERFATFGLWIEQLIAESTGKHGVGILPVVGERADAPDPGSRLYVVLGDGHDGPLPGPSVRLTVEEPADLGAQVFLWEFATAVAGVVLGINPFDQPDVEAAKKLARSVLDGGGDAPPTPEESSIDAALDLVGEGDALVVAAFVDPALEPDLQAARHALGRRAGVPTTLGLGPRFLHSTGQLHKGGPDRIVMVQVLGTDPTDVGIPGGTYTFSQLKHAQADGDLAAVAQAGKRVVRVPLDELLAAGRTG